MSQSVLGKITGFLKKEVSFDTSFELVVLLVVITYSNYYYSNNPHMGYWLHVCQQIALFWMIDALKNVCIYFYNKKGS